MFYLLYKIMLKKVLFSAVLFLLALTSFAQLKGNGYYFVKNFGSGRWAYLCDNYGKLDMGSQSADCGAIQLWRSRNPHEDPSSVIYIKNVSGSSYDLQGQGTGVYKLIGHYVSIYDRSKAAKTDNAYWVYASSNGVTKYLDDESTKSKDNSSCGFNNDGNYRLWSVYKIGEGDNYLGVLPTVTIGSEHFAPYYVSFPFTKTSGMKVYYINKIDSKLGAAVLAEFTGDIVPANMPVFIKCVSGASIDNKILPVVSNASPVAGNLLKGVYFNTPKRLIVTSVAATKYDANTMRVFGVTSSGKLGFITSTASLTAYNSVYYLNANQAYLPVPAGSPDQFTVMTASEYEEMTNTYKVNVSAGAHGKVVINPVADSYKKGTTVTLTATPDEGYSFVSWSNGVKDNPYTFAVSADITVSATFAANKYTITFDTDGGSSVAAITQDYGTSVTAPASPTKEGYTFAGWDVAIPTTMPARNITIKAKWTINQYTIKFDTDGGSAVADMKVNYGAAVSAPSAPTKTGYTFVGWNPAFPATMPAKDLTLTAQWKVNQYKVAFISEGKAISEQMLDYGSVIKAPANPVREGYTFVGWDPAFVEGTKVPVDGATYTAVFKVNAYNLVYVVDGKEYGKSSCEYGKAVTALEAPSKVGYTFSGWSEIPATMPSHDVTITGSFTVNQYTVTFVSEGKAVSEQKLDYGSVINAPANPVREGYTFVGWDPAFVDGTTVPVDGATYTAVFKINTYTVVYMLDGKEYGKSNYTFGENVAPLAEPSKDGYTFSGWSEIPATMPSHDVTVAGSFTVNQYMVTFISDGQPVYEQKLDYGSVIVAPEDPVREGYAFSGWDPAFVEGVTVPVGGATYTAVFKVNPYTIVYMVDGKEYAKAGFSFGETVVALEEPTKEGYTFSGWSEIPATMPANDVTVTGMFTVNQYKVTFVVNGETVSEQIQDYGTVILAPEQPEVEGYEFIGWGPEVDTMVPAKDVTYTAMFVLRTYKVSYYYDDQLLHEDEVKFGEEIPEYTWTPVGSRFEFNGWAGEKFETMPAHDVIYMADVTDAVAGIHKTEMLKVYSLNGTLVKEGKADEMDLPAGIYIVNGRKVVVK